MADRRVTRTGKNQSGDITSLCNAGEMWSPRPKADAIHDIELNLHSYFVVWPDGVRTAIRVVQGPSGKYLRTDRDQTVRNNLQDLPDC